MVKKIGDWYRHFLQNLKDINNVICIYASVSDYKGLFLGNKEEEESKEGEEKHEIKAEGLGRHKDSLERESMSRLTEERIRDSTTS